MAIRDFHGHSIGEGSSVMAASYVELALEGEGPVRELQVGSLSNFKVGSWHAKVTSEDDDRDAEDGKKKPQSSWGVAKDVDITASGLQAVLNAANGLDLSLI